MTRTRIFWSIYCILLGIALLARALFQLDIAFFSLALGLLLLLCGIFILTGGFGMARVRHVTGGGEYVFINGHITVDEDLPKAVIVLGNAIIDVTSPAASITHITCVLGNATVHLPQGYSMRTVCSTAFGSINAPDGSLQGFGDRIFMIGDGLQAQMQVNCVFGQVNLLD